MALPLRYLKWLLRVSDVRRSQLAIFIFFFCGAILSEGFGVFMVLPILQLAATKGDAVSILSDSKIFQQFKDLILAVGLPLNLPILLALCFLGVLGHQLFKYWQVWYAQFLRTQMQRAVSQKYLLNTFAADFTEIEKTPTGERVNDLTNLAQNGTSLFFQLFDIAYGCVLAAAYLAVLAALSPWLTIFAVVCLLALYVVVRGILMRTKTISVASAEAQKALTTLITERLRGLRFIRLSDTQGAEAAEIDSHILRYRDSLRDLSMVRARLPLILEPATLLAIFFMFFIGLNVVGMSFESIILFVGVIIRTQSLAQAAIGNYQGLASTVVFVDLLRARLQWLEAHHEVNKGTQVFGGIRESISFENVIFSYDGNDQSLSALSGVSFKIPVGALCGLVGPSGAGKSTLVDLLPRLRIPSEGTVRIDGVPINEFELTSLRTRIAFVAQRPMLFDVTLRDHICYGSADVTESAIERAVELAGAREFIETLPEGYNTFLGEGGLRLSGGQAQRLDLARAILRRASLLILDEPASNLDAVSEEHLRLALKRIKNETGTTIILIAHGFSTVVDADVIAVLENGRLAAVGRHSELVKQGGWYGKAFAKQQSVFGSGQIISEAV